MTDVGRAKRWVLAVGVFVVVGLVPFGCTVGPDYVPPEPDVPDFWSQEATDGVVEGNSHIHDWWTTFEDPMLDDLIQRAAAGNLDLQSAFTRIKQARALRGVAKGERWPDMDGGGFAERGGISEDLSPTGSKSTDTFYNIGVDATWEIDVWGRITRSIESADAELQASVEDYRDVLVLLYAELAFNYMDTRALQERIRYAESNIQSQRDTLQLTRDREEAQIAPELDVRQAELNLARTESLLPALRQALAQSIHRISVLLGEYPGALIGELSSPQPLPDPPLEVAVSLPKDLVRQRPDIRQAERALAAQTAQIGVATADLYPRFSLSGAFAFDATSDLLDWSKRNWFFGPSFRWNLFDGGRVRGRIDLEEARTDEALVTYRQSVLGALEEVENSIVAYREERYRREALQRSVVAAEKSVELVKVLYRTGLTDFQNVLDMERSLFEQQDQLADSEGLVVQNLVVLYRSLGGGWQPDPAQLQEEMQDQEENGEPII